MTEQTPPPYQQTINISQPDNQMPRTNHVLHGVLTLLTAGLWLPVWITLRLIRGR